jgi:quercetin dioxygenase-like cupin family protein
MFRRDISRHLIWLGVILLAASVLVSARSGETGVHVVMPSEVKWTPVAGYPPGYQRTILEGEADKAVPITYRVRLPAGFRFPPHTHAWTEHVTVLEGTWHLGIGESFDTSRLKALPAGSFVIIPAGTPHFVSTEGEVIAQVHGIGPVGLTFVAK